VQPAAVPDEEEGDCIEVVEVEVQGKDQGCHHLENQYGKVALAAEAGGCASSEHGVECGGEQDSPKFVVHVHFAVQRFGHAGECWVGFGPWMKMRYQQPKKEKRKKKASYMTAHRGNDRQGKKVEELFYSSRNGMTLEGSSEIGGNSVS